MDPWDIEKLDELLFFCCPECNEKEKSKEAFLNHATTKHPHAKERLEKFLFEEEDNKIVIKQEIQQVKSEFYEEEDFDYYYGYGGNHADEPEVLYKPEVEIKTDNNGDTIQKPKKVRKKICQFCKLGFKNIFYLKYHIKTVHPNEVKNEESGAADEEHQPEYKSPVEKKLKKNFKLEDIECKICQKIFSSKSALRAHQITVHQGVRRQKNSICDTCGKAYQTSTHLRIHHRVVHEGQANYVCKVCGKRYTNSGGLAKHVDIVHEGVKYQCEHCAKNFTQIASLRDHIKIKHDEDSENHVQTCDLCGKIYQYRAALTAHKAKVHEGKRVACQFCDKIYTEYGGLKKHMRKFHPFEFSQKMHQKIKKSQYLELVQSSEISVTNTDPS